MVCSAPLKSPCLQRRLGARPWSQPWDLPHCAGEASFAAYGVFDGHGGRATATYASNFLLKTVAAAVDAPFGLASDDEAATAEAAQPANGAPKKPAAGTGAAGEAGRQGHAAVGGSVEELVAALPPEDAAAWRLQAELLRRLPQACAEAFLRCNAEAQRRFPEGGTTASLALATGWELLVANVGDSCAYLDTGTEARDRAMGCQEE